MQKTPPLPMGMAGRVRLKIFRLPGHAVSDLFGLALEHVKSTDPFVLKAREAYLIKKFDSFRNGLNKDLGS